MRVIRSKVPPWWPLAVLAVPALGYTLFCSNQFQYWDGAVGNLVATLLGIIAGVPVALHLERRRAANEAKEKRREEIRIKKEMLTLLREELLDNSDRLQKRAAIDFIPIEPLKTSSWVALRESGDLKYISEPSLISCIANSYRFLAIVQDKEEHFMQCQYGAGAHVVFKNGETASQKFFSMIFHFHSPALLSSQLA
jgi:hypothetical protein